MKKTSSSLLLILTTTLSVATALTYNTLSCSSSRTDAFCQQTIPNSCCATTTTSTTTVNSRGVSSTSVTNTAYFCVPRDMALGLATVVLSNTTTYRFNCTSTAVLASDLCTSGSTPCATLQNSCCATRAASWSGVAA